MEPEELREPMLNDLCRLSALGNIAYAVRCARRIQPRFALPATEPNAAKMKGIVDAAIRWTEEYVRTGAGAVEHGEMLAEASAAVAEATYEETDYAAYAASHCVRGALLAAQAREACDTEVIMEIVAAAFGSSRVVLANTPPWIRLLLVKSLRSDYDKLLAMTLTNTTWRGANLDPRESGPLGNLWQGDTPSW